MKTFIIAEIGSAWRFGEQHRQNAHDAIDIAKKAGADAIKFQWVSNPRKMEQRRNVPEGSYNILAWPVEWIGEFECYARHREIEFMCTVFLPEDVAVLNPYVKRWKVASLECEDEELFYTMGSTTKLVIISTGAMGFTMVPPLLSAAMLHCTVAYPAPLEQLNLNAIKGFSGYSDHSGEELTGALAVACGAEIIEVHFMLDKTPIDNPDSQHSHTPGGLKYYIINIRKAELMLGDGVKKVEQCEEWALKHKVKA